MKYLILLIIVPVSLIAACAPLKSSQSATPIPNASQVADGTLPEFPPAETETRLGFNIEGWV